MGADVHITLERKDGERWIATDTLSGHTDFRGDYSFPCAIARNYKRFAALAGVRGAGPSPLGVPADASETTLFLVRQIGSDGHSHSWMPAKEAANVFLETEYKEPIPESFQTEYPCSYYFGIEESDAEKHRIVFWFDN